MRAGEAAEQAGDRQKSKTRRIVSGIVRIKSAKNKRDSKGKQRDRVTMSSPRMKNVFSIDGELSLTSNRVVPFTNEYRKMINAPLRTYLLRGVYTLEECSDDRSCWAWSRCKILTACSIYQISDTEDAYR